MIAQAQLVPEKRKPLVDSGAFVSCCPKAYALRVPIEPPQRNLNMKTVLDQKMKHHGTKSPVRFSNKNGASMDIEFQVTDCIAPVMAVCERQRKGQLTCFGPKASRPQGPKVPRPQDHK